MMLHDLRRYFERAWQEHWTATHSSMVDFLATKYPTGEIEKLFAEKGIVFSDGMEVELEEWEPDSRHDEDESE